MRVLWYSIGSWFEPSASDVDLVALRRDVDDETIVAAASVADYYFFFEPTPYPNLAYDAIDLAHRLGRSGARRPQRIVAFISYPSPIPFETQCAFASQVGRILGVQTQLQEVSVTTNSQRRVADADKKYSVGGVGSSNNIDAGPRVDWRRALNDAVASGSRSQAIPQASERFADLYLGRRYGEPKFNPTQKGLLHRASRGEISVIAEEIARVLNVNLVTAQRAITAIATEFFDHEDRGRRSPEMVGQLVAQYSWFLRYNEP